MCTKLTRLRDFVDWKSNKNYSHNMSSMNKQRLVDDDDARWNIILINFFIPCRPSSPVELNSFQLKIAQCRKVWNGMEKVIKKAYSIYSPSNSHQFNNFSPSITFAGFCSVRFYKCMIVRLFFVLTFRE